MARAATGARASRGREVAESAPRGAAVPYPALLAGLLALTTGVIQWVVLADLKQLPSPLFGGDYTYQMACIRSILASWNPMASCGCSGTIPGYQPLYGTLVAAVITLTRLPVVQGMLIMSAINHALSVILVYRVTSRRFASGATLVTTALWAALQTTPAVRYTEFTAIVLVPLYFDALLLYLETPGLARASYLGMMLGALGYAHAVTFAAGLAITALSVALMLVWRARRGEGRAALLGFGRSGLVVALGAALAIGYWYQPLFVQHGRTSLHYTEWNGGVDMRTLGLRWDYARSVLLQQLTPWPLADGILHLLCLVGVIRLFRLMPRGRFVGIGIAAIASFVWIFHFLVSMPVLHAHFVPDYVRRFVWQFAAVLVAAVGIAEGLERIRRPARRAAVEVGSVALSLAAMIVQGLALARDPATVAARQPLPAEFAALQTWVYAHTSADDIVLSTNELSFAWAALTGRKTMVTRRAQNDPYVDMDERNRDAALILYGNNQTLRRQLLQRWNVRYVLWTPYWGPSEFPRDSSGNMLQGDPLMYFANPDYDAALGEAGVQRMRAFTFVDPYLRGPKYPRFELTLILPTNYQRADHPWRDGLDASLEPVWSFEQGGVRTAALYRVVP
jgi:hypothetical protein